jgi:hypothetical protein
MRHTTGEKQSPFEQAKSYSTISGSSWEAMLIYSVWAEHKKVLYGLNSRSVSPLETL